MEQTIKKLAAALILSCLNLAGGGLFAAEFEVVDRFSVDGYTVLRGSADITGGNFSVGGTAFVVKGGNVGIGTTSPGQMLDVNGQIRISGGSYHYIETESQHLAFSKKSGGYSYYFRKSDNGLLNGPNIIDLMRIEDSGNVVIPIGSVGIGTGGPGYKLDVQGGDINASGNLREAGAILSGKYAYVGGTNASGSWPISVTGTSAGAAPTGAAGGDLTGNYPNPAFNLGLAHTWTAAQTFNGGAVTIQSDVQLGLKLTASAASLLAANWYRIATLSSTNQAMTVKLKVASSSRHTNTIINIDKGTGYYTAEVYEGGRYTYPQNITKVRIVNMGVNNYVYVDVQIGADENAGTYTVLGDYRGAAANGLVLNAFDDQGTAAAGHVYPVTSVIRSFGDGVSGSPVFTLKEGGNVGIGTTAPRGKLDVSGTIFIADGNQLQIGVSGTSGLQLIGQTGVQALIGSMGSEPLVIRTASAERVRIDTSGNVGIGTVAPAAPLDVNGNISVYKADVGYPAGIGGGIIFSHYGPITTAQTGSGIFSYRDQSDSNYTGLAFKIHNSATTAAAPVIAAVISTAGNVGVGTTAPATKLDVNGDLNFTTLKKDYTLTLGDGTYTDGTWYTLGDVPCAPNDGISYLVQISVLWNGAVNYHQYVGSGFISTLSWANSNPSYVTIPMTTHSSGAVTAYLRQLEHGGTGSATIGIRFSPTITVYGGGYIKVYFKRIF